jgi:hypothetical protein
MIAGAIAGIAKGIVTVMVLTLGVIMGLANARFMGFISSAPEGFLKMDFFIFLIPTIEWNIIWGAVFGFAFAMVYDRIPKKGIVKGIIFSFLFYFILGDIRAAQILWGYRYLGEVLLDMAKGFTLSGIFATITFGIILGYLYKKE